MLSHVHFRFPSVIQRSEKESQSASRVCCCFAESCCYEAKEYVNTIPYFLISFSLSLHAIRIPLSIAGSGSSLISKLTCVALSAFTCHSQQLRRSIDYISLGSLQVLSVSIQPRGGGIKHIPKSGRHNHEQSALTITTRDVRHITRSVSIDHV